MREREGEREREREDQQRHTMTAEGTKRAHTVKNFCLLLDICNNVQLDTKGGNRVQKALPPTGRLHTLLNCCLSLLPFGTK
jgi:hypothetical protein